MQEEIKLLCVKELNDTKCSNWTCFEGDELFNLSDS